MKKSYLFLADGFEEIEALAVVDILRRAEMPLVTLSVDDKPVVTGAHGIPV
ncbi:MAG: DJ-1/PfpI family protein, partial [Bacteroidaceae bacterium]|nr:DJ-1/PfpI family protein [Bacteroidaceae bacterium]